MTIQLRYGATMALLMALLSTHGGCSRSNANAVSETVKIQGAGASFPAPLYGQWIKAFRGTHPHVQVDYQSVGSGSGIKSVIDETVDFGASDAAMSAEEMARVSQGVQLFPVTAGCIVLTYNVEGVQELKLSRKAYASIFLGRVTMWNDPLIAASNPGVALPNKPINVVVRADSSGTTFVFTKHLSEIDADFAKSPGTNKMPNWPVGIRAKGNEGVTASVKTSPNSLGYIEFGYAKSQNLPMAVLENKAGNFVRAGTASAQAALTSTVMPDDLIAWNPDPAAPDAYPIVTYTWLILYRRYSDPKKLQALRDFVRFGLTDGQQLAESLGYVPLPADVAAKVLGALRGVEAAGQG